MQQLRSYDRINSIKLLEYWYITGGRPAKGLGGGLEGGRMIPWHGQVKAHCAAVDHLKPLLVTPNELERNYR